MKEMVEHDHGLFAAGAQTKEFLQFEIGLA